MKNKFAKYFSSLVYIKKRGLINRILSILVILLIFIIFVFPVIWMVAMSLKTKAQNIASPPLFIWEVTYNNYKLAITKYNFLSFLKNSLMVVLPNIIITLLVSCPAAYGLSRFNFKGKKDLAFWILSIRMAPAMAVVLPFFVIGSFLRILDNPIILIIAYLTINVPFAIWILRGFFDEIPIEVEEAGMLEGLSRFGVFLKLSLPIIRGGLAATIILCIIQAYNEFALAMFLTSFNARTLPTLVTQFQSHMGILWGPMAATSLMATIPIIVLTILVRKHLVTGMSFGMVRGK